MPLTAAGDRVSATPCAHAAKVIPLAAPIERVSRSCALTLNTIPDAPPTSQTVPPAELTE
jgi:hypothetical protein